MIRWQDLPAHNISAQFSAPCLSPGTGGSKNKRVFSSACSGFSTMQHMLDNSTPLLIFALLPLPLLLGTWLLPVFPVQCHQHTNHVTPRAPSDSVLTELKKPAMEKSRLLHHHHGGPPTQTGGKARGTAINIISFKTVRRGGLRTTADLNISTTVVVFLQGSKGALLKIGVFFSITLK